MDVGLSVLIPNFNYGKYIGETIQSVLGQASLDTEIVVCDNASTDDSIQVILEFRDDRIRLSVNSCNVGFAANLERVAAMARGRRMMLLSSDDRLKPHALGVYRKLEASLGPRAERAVWGSSQSVIDAAGRITGRVPNDNRLWRDAKIDDALSREIGFPVRAIPSKQLLRRSLELLRAPLPFATTCYSKALHDEVGGYSGGRLVNPDKWFLWKVLAVSDTAYAIDEDLVDYRVHGAGQAAQEQRSGALKHLTDQYVATFNLPESVLASAGIDREAVARAFVEQDIALRGLVSVASGNRISARRAVNFGLATYPALVRASSKIWLLRALLALGPLGTHVARLARTRAQNRWHERESHSTSS